MIKDKVVIITGASSGIGEATAKLLGTISHKATAEGMARVYEQYGISPDRIANVVAFAIDQPEDMTINEFTVGPANQPW